MLAVTQFVLKIAIKLKGLLFYIQKTLLSVKVEHFMNNRKNLLIRLRLIRQDYCA